MQLDGSTPKPTLWSCDTGQKKMIEQKTSHWKLEIFLFNLVTNERLYVNKFVAIYQTWLKFSLNSFTMKLNIHTCYLSFIPKIGRNLPCGTCTTKCCNKGKMTYFQNLTMTVFIWDNTQTIFEDKELSFPIVPASHFKWHRTHKELRGKRKTGDLIISPTFDKQCMIPFYHH